MKSKQITQLTINHYEKYAEDFWEGTQNHDVSQNYDALLSSIQGKQNFKILDLGCGPGRDLKYFKDQGHTAIGIDGCVSFCKKAREFSGCHVMVQDFIELQLDEGFFDGVFANASLLHVPRLDLVQVIDKLNQALKPGGILFSSNPRGHGENWSGSRYANFMELEEYQDLVEGCGFTMERHYYRPDGIPEAQRPWLACIFRKN